ncbi:MAG: class I adenylate-forming enzyme family protein [Aeromicrobium sp.]
MTVCVVTSSESESVQRRAAGALADRGLHEGDRLVLSVGGSPDYVSVVLGATRSGVVPVPIDPRLTPYERDAIISEVEPSLVIDTADALADLTDGPGPAGSRTDLDPWPRCRPMHFTSGTTGRPKGVWSGLLSADHAEALVREERELWGFVPDDIDLVVSPIHHSAPLRFAMGTLLADGSVAVLPRFEPSTFVAAVHHVRPTSMFCVPAHLQRMFAWADDTAASWDPSSFRLVAHAGAPCPDPIRRRTHETFGLDVVWEFYGSRRVSSRPARRRCGWIIRGHSGRLGRAGW